MADDRIGASVTLDGGDHGEDVWTCGAGSGVGQKRTLEKLAASRTAPTREVERAKVLLGCAAGTSITELQRQLGLSRTMIYRCVDKALAAGVQAGLKDKYHRPHEPETRVFEGTAYTFEDARFDYGEQRFETFGLLAGVPVSIGVRR